MVDMDDINSLDDIVQIVKGCLSSWIDDVTKDQPDFYGLSESFKKESDRYHIHNIDFTGILANKDAEIYVCWCQVE